MDYFTNGSPLNMCFIAFRGSATLRNPYAHRTMISQMDVPSKPGSEYWWVDILHRYDKEWPSVRVVDGQLQFRPGFLGVVNDPDLVPHWYFTGLEIITFTIKDRVLQSVVLAVYASIALCIVNAIWQWSPALAIALVINWSLARLSLLKLVWLVLLANGGKMWIYFTFFAARLVDRVLAKYTPGIRHFLMANFAVWMLYVWLTPVDWYPLPIPGIAPGADPLDCVEQIA